MAFYKFAVGVGLITLICGLGSPGFGKALFSVDTPQQFFLQAAPGNQQLTDSWAAVIGMSQSFTVDEPSVVTVRAHVGLHNNSTTEHDSHTMVATQLVTEAKAIAGSMHTTNLDYNRADEDMILFARYKVPAGTHRVTAQAYQHGFPGENPVITVKNPQYSGMFITVKDIDD